MQAVQQFILQCFKKPLNHGNAATLADGSEAWTDFPPPTPAPISCCRPEQAPLVADEILRCRPGTTNRPA
jgi:hypothetical protein